MVRNEEKIWNRFASVYDLIISKDKKAYLQMIGAMRHNLKPDDRVLEITTGTGVIALELSKTLKTLDAIDFSCDMIDKANKKARKLGIRNISFNVQDATRLMYKDNSFDYVIISNALHIMPDPKKVLMEIHRVLDYDGILIAPTFIHKDNKKAEKLSKIMEVTGFKAFHKWTYEEYQFFLQSNGYFVKESKVFKASFPISYVVLKRGTV